MTEQSAIFLADSSISSPINIKQICMDDLKMLILSQNKFSVQQNENLIEYSLGLDCSASVKIYNSIGQVVFTIDSGLIKAGEYEFDFGLLSLPSGAYFFELNTFGLYKKVIGVVR